MSWLARLTLVLVLGPLYVACSSACSTPVEVPPRPAAVPTSATWAGGPDGGAWIDCTPSGREFACTVFNDLTGTVWADGVYAVVPAGGERSLVFTAFDGHSIHLSGNRRLVRVRDRGNR